MAKAYPKGNELLKRSTFGDARSIPWMPFFEPPASGEGFAKNGTYCMRIDHLGANQWDVQLRHREMTIRNEHRYSVRFTAWSSKPVGIRAKVGMSGAPYADYWHDDFELTATPTEFTDSFTAYATDDPTAEFAFHLNDVHAAPPFEICLNDLHLTDPQFIPAPDSVASKPAAVRVNQHGYFPHATKHATWVLDGDDAATRATVPVSFAVLAGSGEVLYRGKTEPLGRDTTSGAYVQRLDFTAVTTAAKDLRIRIETTASADSAIVSDPFAIDPQLLRPLSRDALRFFYYMRSGIALQQPYVEDPIWERIEGHPTDKQVRCAADANCSYAQDVSGGWYDAGDYGKYVVNAGLSVWLLMNLWEVAQVQGFDLVGGEDQALNIPESGNGIPDLLDEVKWEMQWLLKMQVPEGQPHAGLVHHKVHDEAWSALGVLPILSTATKRTLRPVSTAATLNLAATGAQASRIFAKLDPVFSKRCLLAAKRAWAAAKQHPTSLITLADNQGGGAYEDADISDEWYWAATELYLATGEEAYSSSLRTSPHYLQVRTQATDPGLYQSFDWRSTAALATVSIAIDRVRFSEKERTSSRFAIIEAGKRYLELSKADAFGQPYAGTHYTWGSNSFMLNNGIVLAYSHALTKNPRFLEGAGAALDYLLGRNALGKSYVSGYGQRALTNPHHRLWARAVNPKFPPPPPGAIAGGPNTNLQDPYSKAANLGCIGQTCYVDHADAYSVNEVAINWNAGLSWLAAYLNGVRSKTK
jgi:endoglucanase